MAIKQKKDVYADSSPLQLTVAEQHAIYRTLNGNLYADVNASLCKYILLRLDSLLSDGTATYNLPIISVEHVLPQKPDPNSEWAKWFSKDQQSRHIHRLGNLVLLSRHKNYDANNYDFAKKTAIYFSNRGVSPFVLTSYVIQADKWTVDVVERRQRELVSRLACYWNFSNPSQHVVK